MTDKSDVIRQVFLAESAAESRLSRLDGLDAFAIKCAPSFGRDPRPVRQGQVAQLVEQRIENPRVDGSIPPLATKQIKGLHGFVASKPFCFV